MRRSYWIVAKNLKISKESERFIIFSDDKKYEIAAINSELLVIDGCFQVTTHVLELASRHNVTLFFINDGDFIWFSRAIKDEDVNYLICQYEALGYRDDIVKSLINSFYVNGISLAEELGFTFPEPSGNLIDYKLRIIDLFARRLSDLIKISIEKILRIANYLRLFIIAECLDAVIKYGLSPYLGFLHEEFLPYDVELPFEFPLIWNCIIHLRKYFLNSFNFEDYEGRRVLLRNLRNILDSEVEDAKGRKYSFFKHIRLLVKGLRACIMNPALEFESFIIG